MNIQAGDLRHRIEIQRLQKYETDDGFTEMIYRPLRKTWAAVNNLFGKEYWRAKEYGAENTVVFTVRYTAGADITPQDRILYHGNLYNIQHGDNIKHLNKFIKIKAVAEEGGKAYGHGTEQPDPRF